MRPLAPLRRPSVEIETVPARFSILLPRPLSIGLAALMLLAVGAALRIGVPIYRKMVAIRAIEAVGGDVYWRRGAPDWVRARIPYKGRDATCDVVVVAPMPSARRRPRPRLAVPFAGMVISIVRAIGPGP